MKTKHSFYRPHTRVFERGEITHPYTGEVTIPPSMTKQEFVRECDINNIIKMYSTTGMLTHISARAQAGAYLDLPDSSDFQEALHTVRDGEEAFMTLPSKTRERFNNEPSLFLDFLSKSENKAEAIALGLIIPPAPVSTGGETGGTPPPSQGSESPKT